jgi:hypothetical protein
MTRVTLFVYCFLIMTAYMDSEGGGALSLRVQTLLTLIWPDGVVTEPAIWTQTDLEAINIAYLFDEASDDAFCLEDRTHLEFAAARLRQRIVEHTIARHPTASLTWPDEATLSCLGPSNAYNGESSMVLD